MLVRARGRVGRHTKYNANHGHDYTMHEALEPTRTVAVAASGAAVPWVPAAESLESLMLGSASPQPVREALLSAKMDRATAGFGSSSKAPPACEFQSSFHPRQRLLGGETTS